MRYRKRPTFALAVLAAALAGCEDPNALDDTQLTIVDLPDSFSWTVTTLDNVSHVDSYLWTVTGTQVTVDVTQAITDGDAFIQIRDPVGTVMYRQDVRDAVDDTTEVGVSGAWQIDVVLDEVSGEFSFRVNRYTP